MYLKVGEEEKYESKEYTTEDTMEDEEIEETDSEEEGSETDTDEEYNETKLNYK